MVFRGGGMYFPLFASYFVDINICLHPIVKILKIFIFLLYFSISSGMARRRYVSSKGIIRERVEDRELWGSSTY